MSKKFDHEFDFSRWEILAARFIDNDLDEEQLSELSELIENNPALAKVLYTHVCQESLFYDLAKGNGELPDQADLLGEIGHQYIELFEKAPFQKSRSNTIAVNSKKTFPKLNISRILLCSGSTVLVFLLAVTLYYYLPVIFQGNQNISQNLPVLIPTVKTEDSSSAVAVVKLASQIRTNDDSPEIFPKTGDVLYPGKIVFDSGVLVVEFFDGASILVEGPADVRFLSSNHVYCAQGRLLADVPEQAVGFRIDTPQTRIVDLGTSFQVDVRDEQAFINVLEGEIELHGTDEGTKTLLQGDHALVETGGILNRSDETNTNKFLASPVGMPQMLEQLKLEEQTREVEKWQRHYQWINMNPSLLIHFNFAQENLFDARKVRNLAEERPGIPGYGLLVDCRLTRGRWQEKEAVEFRRLSDRCRFNIPGEFSALTMSTWTRVDSLARLYSSILTTDGIDLGEIHWRLLSSGEIELLIHYSHTEPCLQIRSRKVITPSLLGEWVHLAVSVDAENERVVLYLNGEPIHREKFIQTVPIRFKNAQLGNWTIDPSWDSEQPIRHLTGAMESFLFFNRALTEEELRQLYEGFYER